MRTLFASIPPGVRSLLGVLLALQIALYTGGYTHLFGLPEWLGLKPEAVLHGRLWQLITHGFLSAGIVDLAASGIMIVMLAPRLENTWTGWQLWSYCAICCLLPGLVATFCLPGSVVVFGSNCIVTGLLVAWLKFWRDEQVLLFGGIETTVLKTAITFLVIQAVTTIFSCGSLLVYAISLLGGVGGWIYLTALWKWRSNRGAEAVKSDRIGRLEF